MKAMVLAAGLGTRLGEITKTTPKCLVEAGGITMLERVLSRLAAAGVTEAVVNVHYLREKVERFLGERPLPLTVRVSSETALLGTGGGLKHARALLDAQEPFFLHNADVYCELDLAALYRAHHKDAAATLAVMHRPTKRPLIFRRDGVLVGWEVGDGSSDLVPGDHGVLEKWAFSGIHVVSPKLFDFLERDSGDFSIFRTYMHAARAGAAVRAFPMEGAYWVDIGSPEKLAEVRQRLAGGGPR